MRGRYAGWILLAVQLALVLSVAAKDWYERRTLPAVWIRTGQYDPNQPLRGRYLALQLTVNACGLPQDKKHLLDYGDKNPVHHWQWTASLKASDGKLLAVLNDEPAYPSETVRLDYWENHPCDRVPLNPSAEYFIPDRATTPFPLARGQELWVLVTVPKTGPPRPIELALSDATGFHPLRFD